MLDSNMNPIYDNYPNDDGTNVAGVAVLSDVPEPGTFALIAAAGAVAVAVQFGGGRTLVLHGRYCPSPSFR